MNALLNSPFVNQSRLSSILNPVKFGASSPRYYQKKTSVKTLDNQDIHLLKLNEYLHNLYSAGYLYKRKSKHTWEVHDSIKQHHDQELIRPDRTVTTQKTIRPNHVTGKVFLVNKNPQKTDIARLVVNYSQYSHNRKKFPKYVCPNLTGLRQSIPRDSWHLSLDLKGGFYHVPIHQDSSTLLTISDGEIIYGWRKIPMGLGLSPWAMSMFTNCIASYIRNKFNIRCIAYMDDFLLSHHSRSYLLKITPVILQELKQLGVNINFDKLTPEPTRTITFIGRDVVENHLIISRTATSRLEKAFQTLQQQIEPINLQGGGSRTVLPGCILDFKLFQKLTGTLAWVAPFLKHSYTSIQHLSRRAHTTRAKFLDATIIGHILSALTTYQNLPLVGGNTSKQLRWARPDICTDASGQRLGIVYPAYNVAIGYTFDYLEPEHINIKELFAAWLGNELGCIIRQFRVGERRRRFDRRRIVLGIDNTFVLFKNYFKLPPFLYSRLDALLCSPLVYVPTKLNPADAPSRGVQTNFEHPTFASQFPIFYSPKMKRQNHLTHILTQKTHKNNYDALNSPGEQNGAEKVTFSPVATIWR